MKNLIEYYYNIVVDKIKKNQDNYCFKYDRKNFIFVPFYDDIERLKSIYYLLIKNNIYCHEIIYNKDNSMITYYNKKPYILLRKNIIIENSLNINEIINYDIKIIDRQRVNWKKLWEEKIDYYEYQMSEFAFKYNILKKYFNYYIGISENSISLLNYVNQFEFDCYVVHKRINNKYTVDDLMNPLNIIIDNISRDIAEYLKNLYIYNEVSDKYIISIIDNINFTQNESILLLSRLIYPSYFFDLYDDIIKEKINESNVNLIIKKSVMYEALLKKIYKLLYKKYNIPKIDWLDV